MQKTKVHRCRFVDYVPSAIQAISFKPSIQPGDSTFAAVARADGEIEIFNVTEHWLPIMKFYKKDTYETAEGITWVGDRLFSCSLNGRVIEWDLQTGKQKQQIDSYGGAAWCICASSEENILAVGCEDGSVRLFDISDGQLIYSKALKRDQTRILSICWDKKSNLIACGTANSFILLWNPVTLQCVKQMTVEQTKKDDTFIWSVTSLNDGVLVSGDSTGRTSFWDMETGVLLQAFTSHAADVLAVAAYDDFHVFSAGIDTKTVMFQRVRTTSENIPLSLQKWHVSGRGKLHSHDVRAIACNEDLGLVVSGGIDCQLRLHHEPLSFPKGPTSYILPYPLDPIISLAKESHMMLVQKQNSVKVFGLEVNLFENMIMENSSKDDITAEKNSVCLLQLNFKLPIIKAAINNTGSLIAVSDPFETKLFKFNSDEKQVVKIKTFPRSARTIAFIDNILVFTDHNSLIAFDNDSLEEKVLLVDDGNCLNLTLPGLIIKSVVDSKSKNIALCSADNKITIVDIIDFAITDSFPMEKDVTAMAFHHNHPLLLLATFDRCIQIYDLDLKHFSFRSISDPLKNTKERDFIQGFAFHSDRSESFFFYTTSFFGLIDMNRVRQKNPAMITGKRKADHKKKFKNQKECAYKIYNYYKPLMFVDFMDNDMVVVERPWLAVMENFPDAFHEPSFGS
ncbi:WD40 repeat-like protein [Rozella allomycis CSF55]|uniref:WD40 repeat-like protein n=1 Tax=Rozella allomycis (strain CSF55) TaxID=988480 RepID=A0A075AVW7_ROZAC|nr:hypothetical protein O9G_004717 [Rozella allomycis CSF55]RKP18059.1 WD40 repeat-like protein [Rozella allomycis CSF55]|eukprot:EPZ34463.1 hypothetical protein O9G_004717 [Rozella allomycis CSF55]